MGARYQHRKNAKIRSWGRTLGLPLLVRFDTFSFWILPYARAEGVSFRSVPAHYMREVILVS